jgi:cholesterol transport system auxiliary component
MTGPWPTAVHALALALATTPADCALLSRGPPLVVTFYDPLPAAPAIVLPRPARCRLGLGRIDAAEDLREEIEYRPSPREARYYAARRWTEAPDRYLRRALERSLFETGRCERALTLSAPTLDASLVSFCELRGPEEARVAVHVLLHDDETVLWEATIEARAPASPSPGASPFENVVGATSRAFGQVIERITSGVTQVLPAPR